MAVCKGADEPDVLLGVPEAPMSHGEALSMPHMRLQAPLAVWMRRREAAGLKAGLQPPA